jgi:tetratricopeptide (TPR) repeat protein
MGEGGLIPAAQTLARALQADPTHRPSRVALAELLVQLDRWREAIPHFEHAVAADSSDARTSYNLACLLAREGRIEPALRALGVAIDAGYRDMSHLNGDPDLAPLRSHPEFRALVARASRAR